MANIKITELNAASSLAATDVVPVVDVSADETKKITANDLFRTLPDGTAAAPALAFSSDQANGVYLAGTDTVGISTGGTQRVTVDGSGNVTISGDLTVSGATTTVESTTVTIDDKNIELGSVATPTNTTADGGGITLKGATDKTLKWINSTGSWTFNQPMNFNDHVRIDSSGNVLVGTTDSTIYNNGDSDSEGIVLRDGEVVDIARKGDLQLTLNRQTNDGHHIGFFRSGSPKSYIATRNDGFCIDVNSSERLRIDSLGNVGIGVSSLSSSSRLTLLESAGNARTLEIKGANSGGVGSQPGVRFSSFNGDNIGGIFGDTGSDALRIQTGGTDRIYVTNAGKVGVNAASPSYLLTALAGSGSQNIFQAGQTGVSNGYTISSNGSALTHQWYAGSGEAARIDSSGTVGIGATSVDRLLHVQGAGTSGTQVQIEGTSASAGLKFVPASGDNWEVQATTNSALIVYNRTDTAERLRIDSSGNVIIGHTTAAPNSEITVRDTAPQLALYATPGNDSRLNMGDTDDHDIGMIAYANFDNSMRFTTNASERMRINSSGRLLVGTTTTSVHGDRLIEIGNTSRSATFQAITTSTSGTGGIVFADTTTNDTGGYRGSIQYAHSSDSLRLNTSATERMRIDSSGNIGVGTTSPYSAAGYNSLTLNGSTGSQIRFRTGDTDKGLIYNTSSAFNIYSFSGVPLVFHAGASERLRIKSDGTLHAIKSGTQIANAEQTVAVFQRSSASGSTSKISIISGNGAASHINFGDTDDEDVGQIVYDNSNNSMQFLTNTSERMRIDSVGTITCLSGSAPMVWGRAETSGNVTALAFYNNPSSITSFSGQVFRVMCDGDVENSNNAYGSISDIKLKENIVDAGSQWNDIKGLRVRKYNFKESTGLSTHTQIGLVAQEAETVSPGLVKDRFDSDETGKETETVTKSVNYSVLYMKAVKALQEAMERIETLEAKVAALEAQ